MTAEKPVLLEADLTERVIGAFYTVYRELGPGFLESVYENALAIALHELDILATQQTPLHVTFYGQNVGDFRADLLVDRRLIVEIKAVSKLATAHEAQLVNYLKATGIRVGLLMNFGPSAEFQRRVFDPALHHPRSSASIRVQKQCSRKS